MAKKSQSEQEQIREEVLAVLLKNAKKGDARSIDLLGRMKGVDLFTKPEREPAAPAISEATARTLIDIANRLFPEEMAAAPKETPTPAQAPPPSPAQEPPRRETDYQRRRKGIAVARFDAAPPEPVNSPEGAPGAEGATCPEVCRLNQELT